MPNKGEGMIIDGARMAMLENGASFYCTATRWWIEGADGRTLIALDNRYTDETDVDIALSAWTWYMDYYLAEASVAEVR